MLPEKTWPLESVLRFILGILICFCLGPLAGLLIGLITGAHLSGDKEFYGTVVGTISLHGSILILTPFFLREIGSPAREAFGLRHRPIVAFGSGWLLGMVMLVVGMSLLSFLAWAVRHWQAPPPAQPLVQMMQGETGAGRQIYFAVITILVAPIAEEILFRGILFPTLKHRGYHRAAFWGVAILFGLSHYNLLTFLPLTLLGLGLAWIYEKTGNLLAPIVAHSFFNLVNFLWIMFPRQVGGFFEWLLSPLLRLLERM